MYKQCLSELADKETKPRDCDQIMDCSHILHNSFSAKICKSLDVFSTLSDFQLCKYGRQNSDSQKWLMSYPQNL
jgi:hypothetical protein